MIFLFITFKFPKNQLKEDGVMIFCYIIELNIIGWIIIDILYMLKKISKDCGYKYLLLLAIIFVMNFLVLYFGGFESDTLIWFDNNSNFHLVYLLSLIVLFILNVILFFKKLKNKDC